MTSPSTSSRRSSGISRRCAHALILGLSTALLGACATVPAPMAERQCGQGMQPALVDTLYFGTAMPQGRVSAADWADFLRRAVTPRFPQGLSAWSASGQWQGVDGRIVREASYVLSLVHPDDPRSDQALRELIEDYKQRFRQEAVLRVRAQVCTSL